jgi:hypothetical protein
MAVAVASVLAYGEQQIGKPYVFGTAGPDTFDCSGLVQYILGHYGIPAPHHAADQAKMGTGVGKSDIRAGDLVFSNWGDGPNSHVGIATDSSHILVAPHTGTDVQVESLTSNYRSKITAVRRLPQLSDSGDVPVRATAGTPAARTGDAGSGTGATAVAGNPAGEPAWLAGIDAGVGGALSGVNSGLSGIWQSVSGPTLGGLDGVGNALGGLTKAFTLIAVPFEAIGWLLNPNHALRAVSLAAGSALIVVGLVVLYKEARA